jgi:hypothetical protein
MAFALVGCKTAEVAAEPEVVEVATPAVEETTPVAEAPAAETAPAAEAPAVEEAPAAETAVAEEAAPAVEEEPALEPIVQKYVLLGEEVTVIADVGRAEIYYPAIITYEDGLAALAYATENYGAYLEGVTYELHDGYIVLNYPETWGPAEFQVAVEAVQAYVAQVLGTTMEPVEETAAVEVAEAEKIVKTINLLGYEATIEYADKVATITYPSFITNDEVIAAAQAAYAAYSAYLQGTSLVVDNGTAVMTFPTDVTEADLDVVVATLQAELPAYVAAVLGGVPAAAAEAEAEAAAEPIVKTINLLGYEATIEYADKVATITYPSFITNAEVAQAAKAAYASFSKYLEGTELSINNGTAVLTFPQEITEADVDYAVALLEAQLPAYVATLFPAEEPAEVAVVAEAPAAETAAVEEAPAATETAAAETTAPAATESAPAATTTTTTTTTTPAATTTTTPAATTTTTTTTPAASSTTAAATAAAETAKKTNGGLIATIVVLGVAACAAVVILLKKKKK